MRNERVDLLRFIGLAMIILAHVGPPEPVLQLRNFDVPLMVLVSGLAFGLSYKGEPYGSYVWKRVKRLLFPVWIFLSVYFLVILATGYPMAWPGLRKVAGSYLLLSGIGYVWIIRVFLLVALVAPLLLKWNQQTRSSSRYFLVLGAAYLGYELMLLIAGPYMNSGAGKLLESTLFSVVPYAIVFALGLRLPQLSSAQVLRLALAALAACALAAAVLYMRSGELVATQEFKYPPSLYYLSYALGVSLLVWLGSDAWWVGLGHTPLAQPVLFVAQNSIWVYLWHIPFIEMVQLPFYLKYPIVFAAAALITWAQVRCVRQAVLPRMQNVSVKRNVNLLFTG